MSDTTSIFYQIGSKVKDTISAQAAAVLTGDNTWTGTNDFEKAVTVVYGSGKALDIKGTASTSDKLTADSLESTGVTNAKGGLSVTGNATISKNLIVNGDLVISGEETVIDTDSLDVTDNIIKLSSGASGGAYAKDFGLYLERGVDNSASAFVFDESAESFVVGTLEGTAPETIHVDAQSVTLNTNADNEVISISLVTAVPGYPVWTFSPYIATSSTYGNTSTGLGGKKFAAEYRIESGLGAGQYRIEPQFVDGEIVSLKSLGMWSGQSLVSYDFSDLPTGSNADIANTTPAPLTVGSLKLDDTELGDLADFDAGFLAGAS